MSPRPVGYARVSEGGNPVGRGRGSLWTVRVVRCAGEVRPASVDPQHQHVPGAPRPFAHTPCQHALLSILHLYGIVEVQTQGRRTVQREACGPKWMVGGTVSEMWLGRLRACRGAPPKRDGVIGGRRQKVHGCRAFPFASVPLLRYPFPCLGLPHTLLS